MTEQRIETPEQIRLRVAIQRMLQTSTPDAALVLTWLIQGVENLHQRVQQLERQSPHVARLGQTMVVMLRQMPAFRCASGHESLGPVAPRLQEVACAQCGGLAVPVLVERKEQDDHAEGDRSETTEGNAEAAQGHHPAHGHGRTAQRVHADDRAEAQGQEEEQQEGRQVDGAR